MAWTSLSDTLIQVGKACKREIFTTLKSNDEDQESRISSLEVSAAKIIVFDEVIDLASYRTGDVRWSFLTTAQFQAKYGTDWIKIDGSSITGTDLASLYGTTLPDFRNRFPRITDESTRPIGTTEANQNAAHTHSYIDHAGTSGATYNFSPPGNRNDTTVQTGSSGGAEARPDSGVLSAFVRKEDVAINQIRLWRAPFAFTLTSAVCTALTAGSAGTLDIDIKKGSSLGSLSTIFSTTPSVGFAAGDNASSSNAIFSDTSVALGDWLQVDIQGLQTGQSRFHWYLVGESS